MIGEIFGYFLANTKNFNGEVSLPAGSTSASTTLYSVQSNEYLFVYDLKIFSSNVSGNLTISLKDVQGLINQQNKVIPSTINFPVKFVPPLVLPPSDVLNLILESTITYTTVQTVYYEIQAFTVPQSIYEELKDIAQALHIIKRKVLE